VSGQQVYFKIDHSSPAPRYYQIQQNLRDLIEAGVLPVGEMLPSERELSEIYGVSRMTVRQAISALTSAGLVQPVQGIGTMVSRPQVTQVVPNVAGFTERMRTAGHHASSRVLRLEVIPAAPVVAGRLRLLPDVPVVCLERLRLADGEPFMLETAYLPHERFPGLEQENFETQSLYDLLVRRYHTHVYETEQTLEPTLLHLEEADLFGLKSGQPAMLVHIVAYAAEGVPIEFSKSIVRGDRCRFYFHATLRMPGSA
jgi:GntR family transcriptional regulator